LYTESLKNPIKAEAIAKEELQNRKTPQTYSWYAYTLFKNNKIEEANTIYKKYISGKPLEALELYYMGKLMQANNKGYNAKEYFKAAKENIYDLSPTIASDLELKLEE
jgi:tetratricopeptide (TPR) repeat protein